MWHGMRSRQQVWGGTWQLSCNLNERQRGKLWSACVRLGAASTTHLVPRPNSSGVGRGMNERMSCTQNSITKARNSPSRQAAPVLST